MTPLTTILGELIGYYEKLLERLANERRQIDEGTLIVDRRKNGTMYFHEQTQDGRRILTDDPVRTRDLMRARVLDRRMLGLRRDLARIRRFLSGSRTAYSQGALASYARTRFGCSNEEMRHSLWTPAQRTANEQQSENTYKREELRTKTSGGIYVRSFSERIFGELYESLLIPYQYERKYSIDVTAFGELPGTYQVSGRWYKNYYPDFTIPLAAGNIFLHEHLGLIDDREYTAGTGEKLIVYLQSGLVDPEHLLLTFPEDAHNTDRFRKLLESKVIPYL